MKVFSGKFLEVTVEDGIERVFLRGSVHTFLITNDKKIRLVVEKKLGEHGTKEKIQAGILEDNEEPLVCAQRELLEELGVEALGWRELLIQNMSGTINDVRYYFIAKDIKKVSENLDGEILNTIDYSLEDLYEKAMLGDFSPMTQAAIAKLYYEVSKGNIKL